MKTKELLKAIYQDYQYTKCLFEHKCIPAEEFLSITDTYFKILMDEVDRNE